MRKHRIQPAIDKLDLIIAVIVVALLLGFGLSLIIELHNQLILSK